MKVRFQITLHPVLVARAQSIIQKEGYSGLSDYLEDLIRRAADQYSLTHEYAPGSLHDPTAADPSDPNPDPQPKRVTYRKRRE